MKDTWKIVFIASLLLSHGASVLSDSGTIMPVCLISKSPWVDVMTFSGADLGEKFNNAVDNLAAVGGTIVIPPGNYTTATELRLYNNVPTAVWAYGARIHTIGPISGLHIKQTYSGQRYSGDSSWSCTIYGLEVFHNGNNNAVYGINVEGRILTYLVDVSVQADNGVRPGYAAIRYGEDVSQPPNGTGAMGGVIERVRLRGQTGNMPVGILVESWCNGMRISNCWFNNTDNTIQLKTQSGGSIAGYVPNAVTISGNVFNNFRNAITVIGDKTSHIEGLSVLANRFEPDALPIEQNAINLAGMANPSNFSSPFVAGNIMINTDRLIYDPNGVGYRSFDFPGSPSSQGMSLQGVKSIAAYNSGWPDGNNLRGSTTFHGSATASVVFPVAEANNSYYVAIGCNAKERFAVQRKSTTGFTVLSDNAASTATCDWILIR